MFCFPHPTEEWTGLLKIKNITVQYFSPTTDPTYFVMVKHAVVLHNTSLFKLT